MSTFFASSRSAIVLPTVSAVGAIRAALCPCREKSFLRRCSGDQRLAGVVIDDLRVNMFAGKMDRQARTFGRPADTRLRIRL